MDNYITLGARDGDDAVAIANDSIYGLSGQVYGTDAAAASQTATFDDITIDTGTASSGGGEPTVTDLLTVYNAAKA